MNITSDERESAAAVRHQNKTAVEEEEAAGATVPLPPLPIPPPYQRRKSHRPSSTVYCIAAMLSPEGLSRSQILRQVYEVVPYAPKGRAPPNGRSRGMQLHPMQSRLNETVLAQQQLYSHPFDQTRPFHLAPLRSSETAARRQTVEMLQYLSTVEESQRTAIRFEERHAIQQLHRFLKREAADVTPLIMKYPPHMSEGSDLCKSDDSNRMDNAKTTGVAVTLVADSTPPAGDASTTKDRDTEGALAETAYPVELDGQLPVDGPQETQMDSSEATPAEKRMGSFRMRAEKKVVPMVSLSSSGLRAPVQRYETNMASLVIGEANSPTVSCVVPGDELSERRARAAEHFVNDLLTSLSPNVSEPAVSHKESDRVGQECFSMPRRSASVSRSLSSQQDNPSDALSAAALPKQLCMVPNKKSPVSSEGQMKKKTLSSQAPHADKALAERRHRAAGEYVTVILEAAASSFSAPPAAKRSNTDAGWQVADSQSKHGITTAATSPVVRVEQVETLEVARHRAAENYVNDVIKNV